MEKRNIYIIAGVIGVIIAIAGIVIVNAFSLPPEKTEEIEEEVVEEEILEEEEVYESLIDGSEISETEEKMIRGWRTDLN